MEVDINKNLLSVGVQAAYMLSVDNDNFLAYEHVGKYLFDELCQYGISLLNIYVIDEKKEFYHQEVVCDVIGAMQGYDIISVEHYDKSTVTTQVIQTGSFDLFYITFPLYYDEQQIGILEFHSLNELSDELMECLSKLCKSLTVGIQVRLLARCNMLQKQSIDMINEVLKHLHTITNINELTVTFARLTAKYMFFDRVSLFLFDENNEVYTCRCIDYRGKELTIKHIPEIPELENKPVPLSGLSGYWFPLSTNTRKVGVVLFDNIYSSVPFPEWNIEVLSSLCNQFAIAVENINLFLSIQATARRDKLTNIYNRAFLEESIDELEKQIPFSVIIGDVNGLKVTNDVYGHLEGDKILVCISNILQSATNHKGICARWGGDEFLIVLPYTSYTMAGDICRHIKIGCENETSCAVPLSITLGFETKNNENDDFITVLKKAEDMMYSNKQIEREKFNEHFIDTIKNYLNDHCDEGLEHTEALTNLAFKFGMILGLSDYERNNLDSLCLFHDIGKIVISEEILKKETDLTGKEWDALKKHSSLGSRIAHSSFGLKLIEDEILCHHEHWDGRGYPNGKSGSDIPKLSRIFAIMDAYVVITQGRPYRKARSHSEAIQVIADNTGSQFDPRFAKIFVQAFQNGLGC